MEQKPTFRDLVLHMRKHSTTDEEFAQRVAHACATIADRAYFDERDAAAAIRAAFELR